MKSILHKVNPSFRRILVADRSHTVWKTTTTARNTISPAVFGRCGIIERSYTSTNVNLSSDHESIRIGMTPDERRKYFEAGHVDDRGLLMFDTLHEMQIRSCQIFSKKNLFSTYSPETKQFEWMTYQQCT
jgi:hypothetical protein